jgi:hypothetical protein
LGEYEKYFERFVNYIKNEKYNIIALSDHHVVYENRTNIIELSYNADLSKKMIEICSATDFVSIQKYQFKRSDFCSTYYHLFYREDGIRDSIIIKVKEKSGNIEFEVFKNKESELTESFLKEIKKLPKYRLLTITQ